MVVLNRRYHFAASHRLHSPRLNAEENREVYGKCNNPFGHGHNYTLQVSVSGPVDAATGMVINLATLDAVVHREVLDRLHESNLNLDSGLFDDSVPTTENLCIVIFNLLKSRLNGLPEAPGAFLKRIRVEETASNFFEYSG